MNIEFYKHHSEVQSAKRPLVFRIIISRLLHHSDSPLNSAHHVTFVILTTGAFQAQSDSSRIRIRECIVGIVFSDVKLPAIGRRFDVRRTCVCGAMLAARALEDDQS